MQLLRPRRRGSKNPWYAVCIERGTLLPSFQAVVPNPDSFMQASAPEGAALSPEQIEEAKLRAKYGGALPKKKAFQKVRFQG